MTTLLCPNCSEPLEGGWDACPACGVSLCTSCGRVLKSHWQHCPGCKTPTVTGGGWADEASRASSTFGSLATGEAAPFTVLPDAPASRRLPEVANGALLADRYRVEQKLGVGGHGTVYRAIDTLLHDRSLAIKLLPASSPSAVAGIVREYHARKRIRSFEHVLMADQPLPARHHDTDFILYPMDLAEGGNLRGRILALGDVRDSSDRLEAIFDLFSQMCRGVQAVHEAGITHLDLKPENFLLHEGRVKVTDFGIARVLGVASDVRDGVGTAPYMAPEQHLAANPHDVDHRADIYALGVILYELLAGGKRPYEGGDLHHKKTHLKPKPLNLPNPLEALLDHTLQASPDHRPQTIHDLLEHLRRTQESSVTPPTPSTSTSTRQNDSSLGPATRRSKRTVTAELIAPLAKRLAEENNVVWQSLTGTGEHGRIMERDVLDYLARVMAGEESVCDTSQATSADLHARAPGPLLPSGKSTSSLRADLRTRLVQFLSSRGNRLIVETKEIAKRFDLDAAIVSEMLVDVANDPPNGLQLTRVRADAWKIQSTDS